MTSFATLIFCSMHLKIPQNISLNFQLHENAYRLHAIRVSMSSQPWYNQPETFGKPAATDSSAASSAKAAAKGAMKVAGAAGRGIAKGAHAMSQFAANNPWGIRIFSFISSVSLFIVATLGIFGVLFPSSDSRSASFYLFNAYMLMLTLTLFVAECKNEWPGMSRLRPWLLHQFGFLQSNLGRGAFLFFVGIVWFGAWGWTWGLLGFGVMGVGLLYLAAHWTGSGVPNSEQSESSGPKPVAPLKQATGNKHVVLDEDDDPDIP